MAPFLAWRSIHRQMDTPFMIEENVRQQPDALLEETMGDKYHIFIIDNVRPVACGFGLTRRYHKYFLLVHKEEGLCGARPCGGLCYRC